MSGTSSFDQLQSALAAWGAGARIGDRLSGGNRNEVWRVVVDGAPYAARLSPRPPAAIEWELDLLSYLRRHDLRVPAILPTSDGRRRVGGMVLFEWLDGDPPTTERDWRTVERALRTLHHLTANWPQRPTFQSSQELLDDNQGGDVRLDLMPDEAVRRCRAAWRVLAGAPASVIHADPGASNICISTAGAGIFDWDEARVDASILDLAALPLERFADVTADHLQRARTALDAWEAANGWVVEPSYARRRLSALPGPAIRPLRVTGR